MKTHASYIISVFTHCPLGRKPRTQTNMPSGILPWLSLCRHLASLSLYFTSSESPIFPTSFLPFFHLWHHSHVFKCYFLPPPWPCSACALLLPSLTFYASVWQLRINPLTCFPPHFVFSVWLLSTQKLSCLSRGISLISLFSLALCTALSLSLFVMSLSSSPPPYLI